MKQTSGEKMMDWVMRHVMPWFMLVGLIVCVIGFVLAVMSSV
jgi:F0F1-type ATP synthase assembly protein I